MPFLQIQTNLKVDSGTATPLLKSASALVAEKLGKPEDVMMTALTDDQVMTLGGNDSPLAMIEVDVLDLQNDPVPDLAEALASLSAAALGLPVDRIFVKFTSIPRGQWAWNGKVF